MRHTSRKRKNRGFTLAETVAVVAILAVLAAIAIPAVGALRRQLHIAKLDSYARQIYLAAQNELVAMRANGTLVEFETAAAGKGTALAAAPSDYPVDDGSWQRLYAISGGDLNGMLDRAVDSAMRATEQGGSFLVEADPVTGSVYSVFYTEADSLAYDTVLALADRARSTRSRLETPLGYYSGGITAVTGEVGKLEPAVEIVNGEELYVRVTCGGIEDPSMLSGLKLTVTVEGETSGNTWTAPEQVLEMDVVAQTAAWRTPLVLDSLESGKHFQEVCGSPVPGEGLLPGEDVTVVASATYSKDGKTASGVSVPQRANSLFGGRDAEGNLTVSRVRHLNNLRSSIYGDAALVRGGVTVTQTAPIHFDFQEWEETAYVTLTRDTLKDGFTPIENSVLLAGTIYMGNRNPITDFDIRGSGNTGLFAEAAQCTFQGVRLEDCAVTGGQSAGALLGTGTDCTITDCGAYLTYQGNQAAMDLWQDHHTVRGTDEVGGLVGAMTGGAVKTSFAAVDVAGGTSAGGLVGQASGSKVEVCYASGGVSASAHAGGLVGHAQDLTVTDCYSTADITGAANVGGIVGSGTGSVKRSTVYGLVAQEGVANAHPIGRELSVENCRYLQQNGYNTFSGVDGAEPYPYDELRNSGIPNGPTTSKPYAEALQGLGFPFPLLAGNGADGNVEFMMFHYGDWPEEMVNAPLMLVYYEQYTNGSYGIYGLDLSVEPAVEVNALKGNAFTIAKTGYGMLLGAGETAPAITLADGDGTQWTNYLDSDTLTAEFGKDLYSLNDAFSAALQTTEYAKKLVYQDGAAGAKTLYINTQFAAAIYQEAPRTFQFRTAEQLQNSDAHDNTWSFVQTHDVLIPAAGNFGLLNNNAGGASYDGNSFDGTPNRIIGLRQPLFDQNGAVGKLQNLRLTQSEIVGQDGAAGLVLNNNGGTVQNCLVHGSVTAANGDAAGLVLTLNGGSISGCYANCTVTADNGSAAGLVWNAETPITDCYADGHVTAENGSASGFLGSGWGVVTNCYTVADIHGADENKMFGFAPANLNVDDATCHWAYDVEHDARLDYTRSGGTADSLYTVSMMPLSGAWEGASELTTHPDTLTGAYPYPKLKALDHWGDWPEMPENKSRFVTVGVVYNPNGGGHQGGAFGDYIEFGENGNYEIIPFDTRAFGQFKTFRGVYLLTQGSDGFREWNVFADPGKTQMIPLERTKDELLDFATADGNKYEAWKLTTMVEAPTEGTKFYLASADGRYTFLCTVHQGQHQQSIEVLEFK